MSQNNILVPVDFSAQSLIALEQSYSLAKHTGSSISITVLLLDVINNMDEYSKSKFDKLAKQGAMQSDIKTNIMVAKGNPYKQIIKTAKEINAMIIVMGLNPSEIIRNIGNNAFRFLRESPYPVITIKGKSHRKGCKNIVLPLDLTQETREKVNKAIEFAKFYNAAIRVISVRLRKDRHRENKLIFFSHQVQKFIKSKGVTCTIKTMEGEDIAPLVIDYANEAEAD
ncbi:MAG: universal stress protein, partial [Bacteroidetes bacterium]|nr:universal stress protein [Bacteroidota bacterium]